MSNNIENWVRCPSCENKVFIELNDKNKTIETQCYTCNTPLIYYKNNLSLTSK